MSPALRLSLVVVPLLVLLACNGNGLPGTLTCSPPCPPGTTCTAGGCTVNGSPIDLAVPGEDGDLAMSCVPPCAGANPYCTADRVCVPCLTDDHCPSGQVCRHAGTSSACVPGCADDARCGGGTGRCCGGQCIDTSTDPANCGACGMTCAAPNASAACANGACTAGACNLGWGDCDHDPANGCEANLHADTGNCGACGTSCSIANALAGCAGGCYIAACRFGFDDCDGNSGNGCEVTVLSDPKNCGGCGHACTQPPHARSGCINAACQLTACDLGFADCDHSAQNGCEVAVFTDASNCGACGAACGQGLVCRNGGCTCPQCNFANATSKCVNNVCLIDQCVKGFADCNMDTKDGCEAQIDSDANNCGACGKVCPQNLPSCQAGECVNAYLPKGPILNVKVGMLAGWIECYRDQYNNTGTPVATILQKCSGAKLMLACSQHGSDTIAVAAWADRADVLTDTGMGNVTHEANGVAWYFNDSWSWGYALGGDAVSRGSCDTNNTHPEDRLCWHTGGGTINGGYRCGANAGLNQDAGWDRIVYNIP